MNRLAGFKTRCKVNASSFKANLTALSINLMISNGIIVNCKILVNETKHF